MLHSKDHAHPIGDTIIYCSYIGWTVRVCLCCTTVEITQTPDGLFGLYNSRDHTLLRECLGYTTVKITQTPEGLFGLYSYNIHEYCVLSHSMKT